ncbi:MAG: alpha amylase C-terminal domain-containing protein [Bacteroidales bacterium]|nr:alpha amylase C-terminal domain-containing protein [Bacteroidales bacterium]
MNKVPAIAVNDPWLEPYAEIIYRRAMKVVEKESELKGSLNMLSDFATGYLYFGLHRTSEGWVFREWAPNATEIFIVGAFNQWKESDRYRLKRMKNGVWEIAMPPDLLGHGDLYKLSVHWNKGQGYRIPSYVRRVLQDESTKVFNAQVWSPPKGYRWQHDHVDATSRPPLIYEAHVGMSTSEARTGSYNEFRLNVLPRIQKAGYNTIQLMAVQEHPYYGSFGYHVSNYFAASSRFGTPEDLKQLIDTAHGMGVAVIMDLVHSHSVKNELEGLGNFDGTPYQYFHEGTRREHIAWDSLCFDYGRNEVIHFLLSNCKFWLDEYRFDGFRFDGVTSMLYYDHGLSRNFTNYGMYYDGMQDEDAITYLALANKLIKQVNPGSITIAEEMSGMPGLAASFEEGGYGFDFRMAMGVPDYWIKIIKELPDESWNVSELYHELTSKRSDEKTISYAESHDQALVGDKTLIFRLLDKEMYFAMSKIIPSLKVDRGIALHKMIRLVTAATGGGGYLNFMGNEFGHPEWIDFPREGNNWSYQYARRQWNLVDDHLLKYHFLGDFDRDMIGLISGNRLYNEKYCNLVADNRADQVLAFERGEHLFVFNFNPAKSFTDYGIRATPGKYRIVLNTDNPAYGGNGNVDESLTYIARNNIKHGTAYYLLLYIPSRTGLVFKRKKTASVY